MHTQSILSRWLSAPLALLVASLTAGCSGGVVEDLCQTECDCESCSSDALDECIDEGDRVESDAREAGCKQQFDTYSACAEKNLTCQSGSFFISGCSFEKEALTICVAASRNN